MASSLLSPTQRNAAGTLYAIAVHQAQIHQSSPLGLHFDEDDHQRISNGSNSSNDSVSEDPHLWVHPNSGLLRPVFQFLEIDSVAWSGIEETAGASEANHHVGPFLRLLSEDANESSSEMKDQELALAKGVDCMEASMEASTNAETKSDKQREYVQERREKYSVPEISETPSTSDEKEVVKCIQERTGATVSEHDTQSGSEYKFNEEPPQQETPFT